MKTFFAVFMVLLAALVVTAGPAAHGVGVQSDPPTSFDVMEAPIPQLQAAMATGAVTSAQLVKLYLERIAAYEPMLNAFIRVNPRVVAEANSATSNGRAARFAALCTEFQSRSRTTS